MKKVLVVCIVIIISISCFVLPASAESTNTFYIDFNKSTFGKDPFFYFYDFDGALLDARPGGMFWTTSIKPGYLVYCSGKVNNCDYKGIRVYTPSYIMYSNDRDKIYVNPGDFFSIACELVLYNKAKAVVDAVVIDLQFRDSEGNVSNVTSEYYFTSDLPNNGFNEQLVTDFYTTVNTNKIAPDSYIETMTFVFEIQNAGNVSQFSSGAFGIGMFSPYMECYIGSINNAPIYIAPSTDIIDQESALTAEIEQSISAGISNSTELFTDFTSTIGAGTRLYNGIGAVTLMLNEFLHIDFLSDLLNFSLVLGLFSFLLGMGFFVSSFVSNKYGARKEARDNAREAQAARTAYYKSHTRRGG